MPGKSAISKSYSTAPPHEDNYEEVGMDMSEVILFLFKILV